MADKYYSIITNTGKALEAAAIANGTTITLSHFVVGDGSGKDLVPDATSTKLVNEKYRQKIAMLTVSPDQANQLMAQLVIPSEIGGFTVREIGLLTNKGELYALANCAAIEKPVGGINISMQFRLAISDTANITLQVATGDGLFLRMDRNLSDVKDVASARGNLGLKTAALRDVGTDAGQVMQVGAFGVGGQAPHIPAVSTIKASGFTRYGGIGDPDLGNFGTVVSTYYGDTAHYCGQLYLSKEAKECKIRFLADDKPMWSAKLYHEGNKPTAADVGAFSKTESEGRYLKQTGDDIAWLNVKGNATIDGTVNITGSNFLYKSGNYTNADNTRSTNGYRISGIDNLFAETYHYERIGQHHLYGIHVANGGGDARFEFRNSGDFVIYGKDKANIRISDDALIQQDGNIKGSVWGGYLNLWLAKKFDERVDWDSLQKNINTRVDWNSFNQQVGLRATTDWVYQNFIQNVRYSAETQVGANGVWTYHSNTVLTGFNNHDGDYSAESLFWSTIQILKNGQWLTVGR